LNRGQNTIAKEVDISCVGVSKHHEPVYIMGIP
jgi:hypothetical protein